MSQIKYFSLSIIFVLTTLGCSTQPSEKANRLIDSTSPYLAQHAYNPVSWYPWGSEALAKAKEQNKPIILSIGYSSCHWCHVMAHESFEDDSVAAYMNEHFVSIKLDREERPDIDNIYMAAVQAMGINGGWPLNVFLTPDQKPFYGGTYFPKKDWLDLLQQVTKAYEENSDQLSESADQLAAALQASQADKYELKANASAVRDADLKQAMSAFQSTFDGRWGGVKKSPKFPMPSIWQYLLAYSDVYSNSDVQSHTLLTLDRVARGGIYDQIGGGFSRYSVDAQWHVPHFEKMLYDNGQLLSLYANAFKRSQKEEYKKVMMETAQWLEREMMDDSGGFYSALDADSEGEEGKFYVWSYDEMVEIAGADVDLIAEYFDISAKGNWEGKNVLRRLKSDSSFAEKWKLDETVLAMKIDAFRQKALEQRSDRIRPGLDNKIISGWNGHALSGLLDAYQATNEPLFLDLATENASFIQNGLVENDRLLRIRALSTEGFLEDYAAVIQAFIKYYETTFEQSYLRQAQALIDHVIDSFYDEEEKLFFYTGDQSERLIVRKKEIMDNVIPSSNALMAENLYKMGLMMDNEAYKSLANDMLHQASSLVKQEPQYMSHWSLITLMANQPTPELIVVGDDYTEIVRGFHSRYMPNKIIMAGPEETPLPLFEYKTAMDGRSTIYVCYDKVCKRPVHTLVDALEQID